MTITLLLLLASAPIPSAGTSFTCTPTAVYDGDGPIWCAEGPKIRLAGIAAREMDGSCQTTQPCPAMNAEQSRDILVYELGTPTGQLRSGHITLKATGPLTCLSEGADRHGRTIAWCVTQAGKDLQCSLVAKGSVLRWDRFWRGHHCP